MVDGVLEWLTILEWCKLSVCPFSIGLFWMCLEMLTLLLIFAAAPIWLSVDWLKFNSAIELLPNAVVVAVVVVCDVIDDDEEEEDDVVNTKLLLLESRTLLDRLLLTLPAVVFSEDVALVVGIVWKWIAPFASISLIAELPLPILFVVIVNNEHL